MQQGNPQGWRLPAAGRPPQIKKPRFSPGRSFLRN
jgi:hypothetical protein